MPKSKARSEPGEIQDESLLLKSNQSNELARNQVTVLRSAGSFLCQCVSTRAQYFSGSKQPCLGTRSAGGICRTLMLKNTYLQSVCTVGRARITSLARSAACSRQRCMRDASSRVRTCTPAILAAGSRMRDLCNKPQHTRPQNHFSD